MVGLVDPSYSDNRLVRCDSVPMKTRVGSRSTVWGPLSSWSWLGGGLLFCCYDTVRCAPECLEIPSTLKKLLYVHTVLRGRGGYQN